MSMSFGAAGRMLLSVGSAVAAQALVLGVLQAAGGRRGRGLERFRPGAGTRAGRGFPGRVILPLVSRVGEGVVRLIGPHTVTGVRRRLLAAGNPFGLDVGEVLAAQVILGAMAGVTTTGYLALDGNWRPVAPLIAAAAAFQLPALWLDRRANTRQAQILEDVPGMLDLMVVCTDAGLNLPQALAVTAGRTPGPLGAELRRCLQQTEAGTPMAEALRLMAARSGLPDLEALTNAVVRADNLGTPITQLCRDQAQQARWRKRNRIEARIATVPLKLTLVTVFFFLPVLLVLTVVPNLISFATRW